MEKKKSSKGMSALSIIIGLIICITGIVFIFLSNNKTEIYVKQSEGTKTTGLGYSVTYGADFYTETSLNMKYIASATKETYYLIERCFGILLIMIGVLYLVHNIKQIE